MVSNHDVDLADDTGDDEYKMSIFEDHKSYYMWYKEDISHWLTEVWEDLHQNRPVWFTEELIKMIPVELIPHSRQQSVRDEMTVGENLTWNTRKADKAEGAAGDVG